MASPFVWHDPFLNMDVTNALDASSVIPPPADSQLDPVCSPLYNQAHFGQMEPYSSRYSLDSNASTSSSTFDFNLSPMSSGSSGSVAQDASTLASSPPSPRTQPTPEQCSAPPAPQKPKRGRPRLDRSAFPLNQHNKRLPHNQVERKNREGINASLERLRKLIPSLCQNDKLSGLLDPPKPSKAMILEGAIERIKEIEKERDLSRAECKRMRRAWEAAGGCKAALESGAFRPRANVSDRIGSCGD